MIAARIENYRTEYETLCIFDGEVCVGTYKVDGSVMMAQTSRGIQLCAVYADDMGMKHSLIVDVDRLDTSPWVEEEEDKEEDGDDGTSGIESVRDALGLHEDEDEEYRIQDNDTPLRAREVIVTVGRRNRP